MGVLLIRVRLDPVPQASRDLRLLDRWAELEREALEPNPFLAQQLVLPAARHLKGGDSVHLLLAETADRLVFLLPVTAGPGVRGVASAVLSSWMHDYCFLGTPLLSAHHDPDQVWSAVRSALRHSRRAPLLVMRLHAAHGPVAAALGRVDSQECLGVRRSPLALRGFVQRRPDRTYADEWVSKRHLADLARRRRQLSRFLGTPLCTVDRTRADLGAAIQEFLRLEASGWKGRTGTALRCQPGHEQFFREVVEGFAGQGRLMFLSLQAGTRVLAQNIALIGGPGLFGFKKAYDETFARSSPGTLLDLDVIAWFHETRRLDWLDTCSSPDEAAGGQLFGDRRAICTLLLPAGPVGAAAAVMFSTSFRAHMYLRRWRVLHSPRWRRGERHRADRQGRRTE